MTIEAEIQKLTTAITELTAAIYGSAGVASSKEQPDTPEAVSPKKEKPAPKVKAEPKKEKPEAATETAPVVEYTKVQERVLALLDSSRGGSPNNRQAVLDVLAKFEVTTAKALKPEQYAEALEALNGIEA